MVRDGEGKQRQHFYHPGDTICHPKLCNNQTARNVYTLHVDATIMRSFQTKLFSSFLPSAYAGPVNLATAKPWEFMPNVFKISFLPKYRVIYYDYYCKVVLWYIM